MADLPALFWIQLILSTVGFLIALGVFAFRPRDAGTLHFMQLGVGLMIAVSTHAVFSTRELIIDGTVFGWLSRVNSFGMLLFSAALPALLSVYPRRIRAAVPLPAVYYGIALATWLAVLFQMTPDTTYLYTVPLASAIASFLMATLQWRGNHDRPLERAALKWFLLAVLIGTGSFTAVEIIPPIFGHANAVSLEVRVAMGMVLVLSLFVGILLGITRYRLFELERWWFTAWIWFLGGFRHRSRRRAGRPARHYADCRADPVAGAGRPGCISRCASGWSIRHGRQPRGTTARLAPRVIVGDGQESLQRQWRTVLQQAYSPLRILRPPRIGTAHRGRRPDVIVPNVSDEDPCAVPCRQRWAAVHPQRYPPADTLLAMARDPGWHAGTRAQDTGRAAAHPLICMTTMPNCSAWSIAPRARRSNPRSAIDDMRGILTALDAEPLPLEEALTNWRRSPGAGRNPRFHAGQAGQRDPRGSHP